MIKWKWTNELINEFINKWIYEWIFEWIHEYMNEYLNEYMNAWIHKWMKTWINIWMNRWIIYLSWGRLGPERLGTTVPRSSSWSSENSGSWETSWKFLHSGTITN